MSWRILKGQRLNGSFGFDISKPGFDVTTANVMQMAFTSDYKIPKVVIKGSFISTPTSGPAPHPNTKAGATETVTSIYFGRSVSTPAIFAIASAPSWNVPLVTAPTSQLGYLANQWHTYVTEVLPGTGANFDGTYGVNIRKNLGAGYVNGEVPPTWRSANFSMAGYSDHVEFRTNCTSNVTIKYIVMEPQ